MTPIILGAWKDFPPEAEVKYGALRDACAATQDFGIKYVANAVQSSAQCGACLIPLLDRHSRITFGKPEEVASTIAHALTSATPSTRYRAGDSAEPIYFLKLWLPDRLFQSFMIASNTGFGLVQWLNGKK
jgi:hypothetical protein